MMAFMLQEASEFAREGLPLPELLPVILGFLAPLLIQFLANRLTSRTARFVTSLALSAATGVIAYYIAKPPTSDAVDYIIYAFGTAQTAYAMFWRPLWDSKYKAMGLGTVRSIQK